MQYHQLLQKMATNTISETEKEELYAWLSGLSAEEYASVFDEYQQLVTADALPPFQPEWLERAQQRIYQEEAEIEPYQRSARLRTLIVRFAAAALVVIAAVFWWLYHTGTLSNSTPPAQPTALILPGSNGAILTLSNGRRIVLDSLGNGNVAAEQGARITLQNNSLNYTIAADTANATAFNTVTTPKGRQFQLVLADGSRVWLNAASTIRFPAVFTGNERRIRLSGEAYLEVAHMKDKPFFVETDERAEIQVMGTSFNVQAYTGDETLAITLIHGKVKVKGSALYANKTVELQPGQQAIQLHGALQVQLADTEQALAWKNGLFNFENAGVKETMQQLERWYNVEVVYPKGIPDVHFMGYMRRDLSLQEVLKGLQGADLHVTIEEGRKLIVQP
ncbi:MAG: FecR domain-containing protein [Chitinophagaceae bacterium]